MKKRLNKNIKVALIMATLATALTGCGSSSEEEQLTWLTTWNDNYERKIKMLNVCFKKASVKMNKNMSKKQQAIVNECKFSYITEKADDDGVSLDREILQANILQL